MANFNAGAIEGTLTLDRSPFDRDLKEAMAMARAFEKEKIKIPLEIVGEEAFNELEARLQALRDETVNITLDVDGDHQVEELEARLQDIRDETVTIELDVDGYDQIPELEAALKAIPDENVTIEVGTDGVGRSAAEILGGTRALNGMRFAVAGVAAILPTIVPLALGAAAALGALVSAASILVAGVGAFALVAIPAWKQYQKAVKAAKGDLDKLSPAMANLKKEQDRFNKAVSQSGSANKIYALIASGFKALSTAVIAAKPLIDAVTTAFGALLTQVNAFVASPLFTKVIAFLSAEFQPTLMQVMGIIGNLIKTVGGLTVAFAPFMHLFLGGLQQMTGAWANWAAGLSSSDKFQDFIDYVKATGPKVIELFMSVGRAIGNIGKALAPVAGPVLDGLIALFNGIGNINTSALGALLVGLSTAIVLFQAVTAAVALFNLVMAANPIVLVVIAIIALVAAFIYLWKTNEGFRNFFISTWNAIWGFMQAVGAWFAGPFAGFFVGAWNGIKAGLSAIGGFFAAVWNAIKSVVVTVASAIAGFVVAIFNGIKGYIMGWVGAVRAVWSAFWGVFGGVITAAINLVVAVVKLGFALMRLAVNTAMAVIKNIISNTWAGIKIIVSTVVNAVKSVVTAAWNNIKATTSSVWNGIKSLTSSVWNAIKGPVTSAVNAIKGAVSKGWDAVKSATSSVWNALKGIVSSALDGVMSTVNSVVGKIKGVFSGASSWLYNAGRDIIQGLLSGIESLINSVTSKLKALTDKIPKVKGPEEKDKKLLRPAGRYIMGGFIDELDIGIAQALDTLSGFTDKIPGTAELTQQLSLVPTTGPASFPTPAPGITKDEFVAMVSQLIDEIRKNTQPLIGEFNAKDQDPQELAEKWWFISKGRG